MAGLTKTIADFSDDPQVQSRQTQELERNVQESFDEMQREMDAKVAYIRVTFEPATVSNGGDITITKDFGSGLDVQRNAIRLEKGVYLVTGSTQVRSSSGTTGIALGFEVRLDGERIKRFFSRRFNTNSGTTIQPRCSILLNLTKAQSLSFTAYTGGLYSVEFAESTSLSSFAQVQRVA